MFIKKHTFNIHCTKLNIRDFLPCILVDVSGSPFLLSVCGVNRPYSTPLCHWWYQASSRQCYKAVGRTNMADKMCSLSRTPLFSVTQLTLSSPVMPYGVILASSCVFCRRGGRRAYKTCKNWNHCSYVG
jgi:hypothetical protein